MRGEASTDARFQRFVVSGTLETDAEQADLEALAAEIERCEGVPACVCVCVCWAGGGGTLGLPWRTRSTRAHRRCIVAATVKASGAEMALSLAKGSVDHQCQPACALHQLEGSGGTTGTKPERSGHDADAPRHVGGAGHASPHVRALSTSATAWSGEWRGARVCMRA